MKYGKPEVLQLKAIEAIQTQQGFKGSPALDAIVSQRPKPTVGAYEADE